MRERMEIKKRTSSVISINPSRLPSLTRLTALLLSFALNNRSATSNAFHKLAVRPSTALARASIIFDFAIRVCHCCCCDLLICISVAFNYFAPLENHGSPQFVEFDLSYRKSHQAASFFVINAFIDVTRSIQLVL